MVLPAYWVSLVECEGATREAAEYNRMLSEQKIVNELLVMEDGEPVGAGIDVNTSAEQ